MLGPVRRLVPSVIRRSYALKFMIVLLVLGLSIGTIAYAGTDQIAGQLEHQIDDTLETVTTQEAERVDQWHERNQLLASSTASEVATSDDWTATLDRTVADEDAVSAVHYVDLEAERTLASSNDDLSGRSLSTIDEPWAAMILESGSDSDFRTNDAATGVSNDAPLEAPVIGSTEDGQPALFYLEPVSDGNEGGDADADGDRITVTAISMDSFVERMGARDDSVTFVVSADPTSGDAVATTGGDEDNDEEVATVETGDGDDPDTTGSTPLVVMDSTGASTLEPYSVDVAFAAVGDEPARFSIGEPTPPLDRSVDDDLVDEPHVATVAPLGTVDDWYVVMHTAESDAYGVVHAVSELGVLATLASVAILILVVGFFGRTTSRSIDRLTAKAERMEAGDLDVTFETDRIDSIGRLYHGFETMRDSLSEQIREANEARSRAEAERERVERINAELEAAAAEYCAVMGEAAAGDLTVRADVDTENETMAAIGEELDEMLAEIEETTDRVTAFASTVATASASVADSSRSVRHSSIRVTESVGEISAGATRQHDHLEAVTQEMNGLSTTVEEIAASSNQVADVAQRTAETGTRGRNAATEAIEGMTEIDRESEAAVEAIERLEAEMAQIDELIEFISSVADQTNMLALNANIEAARSGGADEGFSVVAQEVKELATETKDAAADVEDRLERIKDRTEQTVDEVRDTSDRVSAHTDAVERAAAALSEIATLATETNEGIQEISAATQQQAAATQEVVAMVDEVSTISKETNVESERVASAARAQTAALDDVTKSASALSDRAARLSDTLDRFTTDGDGADWVGDVVLQDDDVGFALDSGSNSSADIRSDSANRTASVGTGSSSIDAERAYPIDSSNQVTDSVGDGVDPIGNRPNSGDLGVDSVTDHAGSRDGDEFEPEVFDNRHEGTELLDEGTTFDDSDQLESPQQGTSPAASSRETTEREPEDVLGGFVMDTVEAPTPSPSDPSETVESGSDSETEAGPETDSEAEAEAEPGPETEVGTETEPESEVGTETEPESEVGTEAEPESEAGTETEAETDRQTESDSEPATKAEPDIDTVSTGGSADHPSIETDESVSWEPDIDGEELLSDSSTRSGGSGRTESEDSGLPSDIGDATEMPSDDGWVEESADRTTAEPTNWEELSFDVDETQGEEAGVPPVESDVDHGTTGSDSEADEAPVEDELTPPVEPDSEMESDSSVETGPTDETHSSRESTVDTANDGQSVSDDDDGTDTDEMDVIAVPPAPDGNEPASTGEEKDDESTRMQDADTSTGSEGNGSADSPVGQDGDTEGMTDDER